MSDVVVLRLKTHGHRFEVPCLRRKINDYIEKGRDKPLPTTAGVSVHPHIMSNAYKREHATNAALNEAFGTTEFEPIALAVIQFGEVVVNDTERAQQKKGKQHLQEDVQKLLFKLLTNKFSGVAPERDEVREAYKTLSKTVKLVEGADAWPQACYFAFRMCNEGALDMDCVRSCKRVKALVPHSANELWDELFMDFDGVLTCRRKDEEDVPAPAPAVAKRAEEEDLKKGAQHDGELEGEASEPTEAKEPTEVTHKAKKREEKCFYRLQLLVDDAFLQAAHPRWLEAIHTATEHNIEDATPRESDFFTRYEFEMPMPPKSSAKLDAENRLYAAVGGGIEDSSRKQQAQHFVLPDTHRQGKQAGGGGRNAKKGGKKGKRHGDSDSDDDGSAQKPGAAQQPSPYESMTLKKLQDLAKQRGLSTGGKKIDIIERLEVMDETSKPVKRGGKK